MTRGKKRNCSLGFVSALLAVCMTATACGIIIMPEGTVLDQPFQEDQAKQILDNRTTKKEILAWFGPPLVVARPGSIVLMPEQELYNAMSVKVSSDRLFERFKPGLSPLQSPLLYYYEDQALSWSNVGMVFFWPFPPVAVGGTKPLDNKLKVTKLWVLLDEATGRVVDHQVEEAVQELTGEQLEGLEPRRMGL